MSVVPRWRSSCMEWKTHLPPNPPRSNHYYQFVYRSRNHSWTLKGRVVDRNKFIFCSVGGISNFSFFCCWMKKGYQKCKWQDWRWPLKAKEFDMYPDPDTKEVPERAEIYWYPFQIPTPKYYCQRTVHNPILLPLLFPLCTLCGWFKQEKVGENQGG